MQNLVKPNLHLKAINANATLVNLWSGNASLVLELSMGGAAHAERGAPASLMARIECSSSELEYTLRIFDKTATHAPETLWFSSQPPLLNAMNTSEPRDGVWLDKLGGQIEAREADLGCGGHQQTCGVHLHGIGDRGATIRAGARTLTLRALDSALVSIGPMDAVPTPLRAPDPSGGVHFGLVGNMWNTNYP